MGLLWNKIEDIFVVIFWEVFLDVYKREMLLFFFLVYDLFGLVLLVLFVGKFLYWEVWLIWLIFLIFLGLESFWDGCKVVEEIGKELFRLSLSFM